MTSRCVPLTADDGDRVVVDIVDMHEQSAVHPNKPPRPVIRRLVFQPSPRVACTLEFTVLETERLFPLFGWGSKRLPSDRPAWANLNGKQAGNTLKVSSALDEEQHNWMEWDGDWELRIHPEETDKDGWQYSIDFPQTFHAHKKASDFVRRRMWTRRSHSVRSMAQASNLHLSKELQAFVTRKSFFPCAKDLSALQNLEATLALQTELNETLEFNIREAIARDEVCDCEEIWWHQLHNWAEADRLDICQAMRDNAKSLATAQSDLLDKWTSKRGPRQSAIEIRIESAENVPCGFATTHKLRVAVKFLSNDVEICSDVERFASHPTFKTFSAFAVVPDDTKPILITLEAVAHGVAELVTEPIAIGVAPFNPRAKYPNLVREVDATTLVFTERGRAVLNCLDERGREQTAINIKVSWVLEPRELTEIEFCEVCGSMIRLCSCTQSEIEARQREHAVAEAQRQAEIYAARADRLAKQRAEQDALFKERREQQQRAFEKQQATLGASEADDRSSLCRSAEEEYLGIARRWKESVKRLEFEARKREVLRVVFKIRLDEVQDERVAVALRFFVLLKQYSEQQKELKALGVILAEIATALRDVEIEETLQRDAVHSSLDKAIADLKSFENDQRPLPPPAPKPQRAALQPEAAVIEPSQQDKEVIQANFKKEKESKSGCCSVM